MSQIFNPSTATNSSGFNTVTAQISGVSSLPSNSGTAHYIVVTTTGGTGSIGQVYADNGTSTGTVTVLSAATGNTIIPTVNLTGGTITLAAYQEYTWSGSAWKPVGATHFVPSFMFGGM